MWPILVNSARLASSIISWSLNLLRVRRIRKFVMPILAWEAAGPVLDYVVFALKVRSVDWIRGWTSDSREAVLFLEEQSLTPEEFVYLPRDELDRRIEEYEAYRARLLELPADY